MRQRPSRCLRRVFHRISQEVLLFECLRPYVACEQRLHCSRECGYGISGGGTQVFAFFSHLQQWEPRDPAASDSSCRLQTLSGQGGERAYVNRRTCDDKSRSTESAYEHRLEVITERVRDD